MSRKISSWWYEYRFKSIYNKPVKTIDELYDLLVERGLNFHDIECKTKLKKHLELIWYYRLSIYFKEYQTIDIIWNEVFDKFLDNVYYKDIIDLYNFDRKLRLLVWNIIEKFENSLKSVLINYLIYHNNNFKSYIEDRNLYSNWLSINKINELKNEYFSIKSDNHDITITFKKNYLDEFPPVHMYVQVLTLGNVVNMIASMRDIHKQNIASKFFYNDIKGFIDDIMVIKDIRNTVYHHNLLFSKKFRNLKFNSYIVLLFKFKNILFKDSDIDKQIIDLYEEYKYLIPVLDNYIVQKKN